MIEKSKEVSEASSSSEEPAAAQDTKRDQNTDSDASSGYGSEDPEGVFENTQTVIKDLAAIMLRKNIEKVSNILNLQKAVKERVEGEESAKGHKILPKGMKVKALYDNEKFDRWYKKFVRVPPKTYEQLCDRKYKRNHRQRVRRRLRRERAEARKQEEDDNISVSLSSAEGSSSQSSKASKQSANNSDESYHEVYNADQKKTSTYNKSVTHAQFHDSMKNLQKQLLSQPIATLGDGFESDEELKTQEGLDDLIRQIYAPEEQFTLNLPDEIRKILEHFKVTVVGSHEKRVSKRLRLTNHFFRQFSKYIRAEKYWASYKHKRPKVPDELMKETYEDMLERQEKELKRDWADMCQLTGDKPEDLQRFMTERLHQKLIGSSMDEQHENDLFEA